MELIELLRVVFGSIFVLFLPGFAWSYVFFEKGGIDEIERIALSFGLSIALVPLVVFYLNWLFGVKINLLNSTMVIIGLIAVPLMYHVIVRQKRFHGLMKKTDSGKDQ